MSKYEEDLARELSVQQWEFLTDHCDGSRPAITRSFHWNEARIRLALERRGLIRVEPPPRISSIPTHTVLTDKGRAVTCAALGLMADMLTRNGYDGIKSPTEIEKKAYGKFVTRRPHYQIDDSDIVGSESGPV